MGSVLVSSTCHYCGDKATTDDHVVPRSLLPKPQSLLPYWFRAMNVVPACAPCNGAKANHRSDCHCTQCVRAWGSAAALYGIVEPEPVSVLELRRELVRVQNRNRKRQRNNESRRRRVREEYKRRFGSYPPSRARQ